MPSERDANARLIASAPTLLDALSELVAFAVDPDVTLTEDWNVVKDARAALALARGEEA